MNQHLLKMFHLLKKVKKILIVSHALELGGAERSLIGLLDAIDKKEYKVDLFLLRHEGELLSFIPEILQNPKKKLNFGPKGENDHGKNNT